MTNYLINKYSRIISQAETEVLLCEIFRCTREEIYVSNVPADECIEDRCDLLIQRRLSGEPLQYITGNSQFMGQDFIVNKDVFIPRPETEILVNEVFRRAIHDSRFTIHDLRILDLCTGCGNIAVSLARILGGAEIVATDISESALKIAQKNAVVHGVDKCITFYNGYLFQALPIDKKYKFDIIVCNPPYVKSGNVDFLQEEVRREPRIALDGGDDGLEFYRQITDLAPAFLKSGGSLFLETGFDQVKEVKGIFCSKKSFKLCKVKKDFAGIDRVIWISLS